MPFPYPKIINFPGLDVTDILHHSQERATPARSTKDKFSCGTGILPVPKQVIENGARYKI